MRVSLVAADVFNSAAKYCTKLCWKREKNYAKVAHMSLAFCERI